MGHIVQPLIGCGHVTWLRTETQREETFKPCPSRPCQAGLCMVAPPDHPTPLHPILCPPPGSLLLLSGWCGDGRHCPRWEGWEEAGVSPRLLSCLGTVFLAGLLPPLRPGLPPHPFWCGVATASHPEPGHWVPSTPWTLTLCTLFSMAPSLLCRAPAGEAICLQTAP